MFLPIYFGEEINNDLPDTESITSDLQLFGKTNVIMILVFIGFE